MPPRDTADPRTYDSNMPMHFSPRMVARLLAAVLTLVSVSPAMAQFGGAITIDDQPTAEQKLIEINDLRRAERYDDAAEVVQELVDASRFKLVATGEGKYIDAERWVRRELVRDPALQEAYRKRFTAEAERVVGDAVKARDMALLRDAYRRYAVTRPGMEAGMVLAGLLLESGDAAAAWALSYELLDHPDLPEQRARVLSLHGAAGALMGDGELVNDVAQRLRKADAAQEAEALEALATSVSNPMTGWSRPVVDAGAAPTALDVPLWSEPMARRGTELPSVRQKVDELRILPVATRDVIFVNTTRQVLAMDRAAGPVLWAYPDNQLVPGSERVPTRGTKWPDTRGVAVTGGRVFAVLGECDGLSGNARDEVIPNRLVCLDRSSGAELWARMAGQVQEGEPRLFDDRRGERVNLQQTHFVGTPIVADGQVLVMLRRASQLGVQTNWLLAFDAGTGELQWLRHLALAQVMQGSGNVYVAPQITLAGDTLYITDSIGVVAAIDPRSGAYLWLTVVADEGDARINLQTEGVLSPPVMTRSGLVVALASTRQRLLLLDPEDGAVLNDLSSVAGLIGVRYILDAAGDVLVVTNDAVALWDGEQGTVSWQTPHEQEPRGHGDVSKQFAVIPTLSGARVLSLADGSVLGQITDTTGNITVLEEEVLVTAGGQLHSYMSWDRAYDRLVRRIGQRPNDPDAGLALASLALRQGGRREAVMQGVDYAMAAVDRLAGQQAEAAGQRVFDRLRDLASETREADDDLRMQLYDRLALASRSASQEVAYHLDFGRYLVWVDQPGLAVEHFQAVMVDPAFAGQAYLHNGQTQPAGATAQRELERLVRENGRSVYARFDALAWQRLEMLAARPDAQPADYALIAQRYPLSEAASPALLAAAKVLAKQDQPFGELSYCQQAVARAMNDQQRDAALGAMLAVHLRSSSRQEAEHVVRWVQRQFPGSRPIRNDQPTELESWLAAAQTLDDQTTDQIVLPDTLTQATRLTGRMVRPAPGLPASVADASRFYLIDQGKLRRVDVNQPHTPAWEIPLPNGGGLVHLLADDRGQLLVWLVEANQIHALDVRTGQSIWNRPADLSNIVTAGGGGAGNLGLFEPSNLPHVAVSPTVICFASRDGEVVAIDRYLGTPLWRYRLGMAKATAIAVDGWTLAVAGIDGPETQLGHGRVLIMDLLTGEPRLDQIDLHVGFQPEFLAIDDGKFVVAGGSRAACFSLDQGNQLWNETVLSSSGSGVFALGGGTLVIEAADGMAHVFDVNDGGKLLGMYDLGDPMIRLTQRGRSQTMLVQDQGQILLVSPRAVARFNDQPGGLKWRDALHDQRQKLYGLALGATRLAVLYAPDDAGPDPDRILPANNPVSFSICIFDRDGGQLISQTPIGPIHDQPEPTALQSVQGGIVLPMGPTTLLLTGQTSGAQDQQPR